MASATMVRSILGKCTDGFAVAGALAVSYIALRLMCSVITGLKTYVFARSLGLSKDLKKNGTWAVITGCTDGIGKAYAQQIAAQGLNCVLISRTKSKLEEVAKELETVNKIQTLIIVADFSAGFDIYPAIQKKLEGLDIGVLVNNVGLSYSYPEFFLDVPNRDQMMKDLINVNIVSVTMMTSVILPGMVERKRGVVINVSSISGVGPTPLLTGYSASKAFVGFMTKCLESEYGSSGITFQTISPFFVATKMAKVKKPRWNIPAPDTFVRSALATVGVNSDTCGYWAHDFMRFFTRSLLPESFVTDHTKSSLLAVRNKYLKRQATKSE